MMAVHGFLCSKNEAVAVNFGAQPFMFHLEVCKPRLQVLLQLGQSPDVLPSHLISASLHQFSI